MLTSLVPKGTVSEMSRGMGAEVRERVGQEGPT